MKRLPGCYLNDAGKTAWPTRARAAMRLARPLPGRTCDTFGLGYFHVGLSSDFKDLLAGPLAPPGLAQRDEQGVELFYNARLTPWCHLSGDVQIVQPSTKIVDTTILAGVRLKIDF